MENGFFQKLGLQIILMEIFTKKAEEVTKANTNRF